MPKKWSETNPTATIPSALSISETLTPPEFSVEGERGIDHEYDGCYAVIHFGGFSSENGFHYCLISNEQESGRNLPIAKNQLSDDLVQ